MKKILAVILFLGLFINAVFLFAEDGSFIYNYEGLRDPFFVLVDESGRIIDFEPKGGLSEIYLEGIIYDENGVSLAVVNSEIVKEQDVVASYVIKKIKPSSLILIKDAQEIEVKLEREEE